MSKVYLIYEDDYGGTFSPYVLTAIYQNYEDAVNHIKSSNGLAKLVESENLGLDKKNYKEFSGGLWQKN